MSKPPSCTLSNVLPKSDVPDANYCPYTWATTLNSPRGIIVAANGDVLVVESGYGRVTALWDDNKDGVSGSTERAVLASQSGLNHGIEIDDVNGFLYASTPTDVYRWSYKAGMRANLGTAQHVIANIPCCHHTTRTLRFSPDVQYLYVQSGSEENVATNSSHSQIRRFPTASLNPSTLVQWSDGQLAADGMRNEVGVRFDPLGNIWGVENGVDDLYREDLGGDIHNDNPCEELNLVEVKTGTIGKFYGYPYCWSEAMLAIPPGKGPMTQWQQQPEFAGSLYTDAWCQTLSNVQPPLFCFPAHNAPLDILFGTITSSAGSQQTAFVTFHGSWDRQPPDGYNVRYVTWANPTDGKTYGNITSIDLLKYAGPGAYTAGWIRPVALGLITNIHGPTLVISSDATNNIIALSYGVS